MRLTSSYKGKEHHVTIPRQKPLRVGTLGSIVKAVAAYLEINGEKLMEDLLWNYYWLPCHEEQFCLK